MEWTRDKTLRLLREYQQRRVLWDWKAEGYRDRVKRKRAIENLAKTIGCNRLELEKKITNLKCQYSREVHKIQHSKDSASGPEGIYVSKWFAFKAMSFLKFGTRRYTRKNKQQRSMESKLDEEEEEYIVSDIDPENIKFVESNDEEGSFGISHSEADPEEESLSSRLMTVTTRMPSEICGNNGNHFLREITMDPSNHARTKEEYMKFGESIALQLAEIPDSYSRSVAKLRINQILFEAEIGIYSQTDRERFDVVIYANQIPGRYVVGFRGFEDCQGLIHEAFLDYDEGDYSTEATIETPSFQSSGEIVDADVITLGNGIYCDVESDKPRTTVCSLSLKGLPTNDNSNYEHEERSVETHYVPFDINSYEGIEDTMTDYSFNIYDSSYYPSYLSSTTKAVQIGQVNRMTFEYPSSTILSQPESALDDTLCSIEEPSTLCKTSEQFFCRCTQILRLASNMTFDIVLIDEGFGGNVSHTFHVHGYDVRIIGFGQFEKATRKEQIIDLDRRGLLRRDKLADALQKDTFVIPNKGYLVLRIHTDNNGYWLWESRSTLLNAGNNGQPPMQFLMLVGNQENLPTVPIDFPTCGNHKAPASIFHDTD